MRVCVLGVQELDFTTADGTKINGKSIYCGFENRYVDGLKTNKFFIPKDMENYKDVVPNCDMELSFNYNGKIDSVSIY